MAMLSPKRTKYRKQFRGRMRGAAVTGSSVNAGEVGLKAMEPGWITARQIESARIAVTRHLRRGGQVWVRVFPDKSVSKKPAETRMGGGKAAVDYWVAVVKPGRILFEVAGVPQDDAVEALRLASQKLPLATKTVFRDRLATAASNAAVA